MEYKTNVNLQTLNLMSQNHHQFLKNDRLPMGRERERARERERDGKTKLIVRTRFESLAQKVNGLWSKEPKTMNLQRMDWKNQALMNQTNVKVDLDDKRMKLNRFVVKKIVRGDQFLYISLRFDYKVSSRLLQYFPLDFRSPILIAPPSFIPFSSLPSTCRPGWLILILVPSAFSQNL